MRFKINYFFTKNQILKKGIHPKEKGIESFIKILVDKLIF
jgi:hypothetical protein